MDSADNCFAFLDSKFLQGSHDFHSREAVKAGGWLVEQYHFWISDQLYTDGCSFTFTSRYTLLENGADDSVLTIAKSQVLNQLIDASFLLLLTDVESESGGKSKGLFNREISEDDIILHDVRCVLAECIHSDRVLVIKFDLSSPAHTITDCNSITQ